MLPTPRAPHTSRSHYPLLQVGAINDAIDLVVEENDDTLWKDLIDECFKSDKSKFIKELLDRAGAHIDPGRIVLVGYCVA